jgi:hypothetical protein
MRSADSWIGVSGFLISWAIRRATSFQAALRWAATRSGDVIEGQDQTLGHVTGPAHPKSSRLAVARQVDFDLGVGSALEDRLDDDVELRRGLDQIQDRRHLRVD